MAKIPRSRLKIVFSEIAHGYSKTKCGDLGDVYIKHLNNFDVSELDTRYEESYQHAINQGIETIKQKEALIISSGFWSNDKEREIFQLQNYIKGLKSTITKLPGKMEIEQVKAQLNESQEKLEILANEKKQLIGLTAEDFANKRSNDFYIQKSFFKDSSIQKPLFPEEDFEELSDIDLDALVGIYNSFSTNFMEVNLQRIALFPFFMNMLSLSDNNPVRFWGKPIVNLTFYQMDLFANGLHLKSILSDNKIELDEYLLDNPDKLIEMADKSKNINKIANSHQTGVTALVGLSNEELKNAGINTNDSIDFSREMKKRGKTRLTRDDISDILQ